MLFIRAILFWIKNLKGISSHSFTTLCFDNLEEEKP